MRLAFFSLAVGLLLIGCSQSEPEAFDPKQSEYFATSDQIIDVDGQSIRYRETGDTDAPTLLLLHGFSDSLHTWDEIAEELEQDFRLIRPDLPGHGLSGQPSDEDYSNEALVTFVDQLVARLDLSDVTIVGNSLGGLTAWRYAAQAPDTVQGLILLAPGGVPHNGVTEEPQPVPAMLRFYLKNAPEAGVRAALEAMHVDDTLVTDERVQVMRDMMKVPGNGEGFVARASRFTLPAPEADMKQVEAPTLLIWGAEDAVLPAAHAEVFSDNIPQIETIILKDVGHMPQSEAPQRVVDMIRSFAMQVGDGS